LPADNAIDINDDGIVGGRVREAANPFGGNESTAFVWSREGGLDTNILPRINVGLSPKKLTGHASSINNRGDIGMVGNGIATYGIIRYANGKSDDIGHLGGMITLLTDVNDKGEAVGFSKAGRTTVRAFLYRNQTLLDIGTLGGESGAYGINNKSQVVGSSKDQLARMRGFLWEKVG
jgi:probable HAF family extracellular repeat protein